MCTVKGNSVFTMESHPNSIEEATSTPAFAVVLPPTHQKRRRSEDSGLQLSTKVQHCGEERGPVGVTEGGRKQEAGKKEDNGGKGQVGRGANAGRLAEMTWNEREIQAEFKHYQTTILDQMLSPSYDQQWAEDCRCFETLRYVRSLTDCPLPKKRILPVRSEHSKLLIFDLDNTLVHCSPTVENAHHCLNVTLPSGKTVTAGIRIRPFALDCLHLASKLFEVAIFTASHSCYSEKVIDLLDPERDKVHHRLFREDCVTVEQKYLIKDLRVIENYDLKDVAIVENSIVSYGLQLYNGIPVPTWTGQEDDTHLQLLMTYLRALSECDDVRTLNRQVFEPYYRCLTDEDA